MWTFGETEGDCGFGGCTWAWLESLLSSWEGLLSRIPCQVGSQSMLHNWGGSLAGLLAWVRSRAMSSNWSGP